MSQKLSEHTTAIFDDVKQNMITRIEETPDKETFVSISNETGKNVYIMHKSFNEIFDYLCDQKNLVCRAYWEGLK